MLTIYTLEELINRIKVFYPEEYLPFFVEMLELEFNGVESISLFEENNNIYSLIKNHNPQTNLDNELLIYSVIEVLDFDYRVDFVNGYLIVREGEVLSSHLEYADFLLNDVVIRMNIGKNYYCYDKYVNNELVTFHTDFQSEIIKLKANNLLDFVNNTAEAINLINIDYNNYFKLPNQFILNEHVAVVFIDKFKLGFYFLDKDLMNSEVIANYQIIQKGNYSNYLYFKDEIKAKKIYYELAIKDSFNMKFVPTVTQNQLEFAYTVINISPNGLSSLLPIWRDNEEIVKYCLQMDGLTLYYASDRLRRNEEIINIAVNQNPEARNYDLRIKGNENNTPNKENDDLPF